MLKEEEEEEEMLAVYNSKMRLTLSKNKCD